MHLNYGDISYNQLMNQIFLQEIETLLYNTVIATINIMKKSPTSQITCA